VCERYGAASCVDPNWAEWPVPNSSVDSPPASNLQSYADNGDGTVTDNVTKLMWQQATPPQYLAWSAAVAYCGTLQLGGHHDWRLPSIVERASIVDFTVSPPAVAISGTYFPNAPAVAEWSATPVAGSSPSQAWVVTDGATIQNTVTQQNAVRCVR
jgi:hypothetical protein